MQQHLNVGQKYLAIQAAYSFEDIDGKTVNFEGKKIEIKILPKPEKVTVFDGVKEWVEGLPEHLKSDCWYSVRNIETGKTHWFNALSYQISKL